MTFLEMIMKGSEQRSPILSGVEVCLYQEVTLELVTRSAKQDLTLETCNQECQIRDISGLKVVWAHNMGQWLMPY